MITAIEIENFKAFGDRQRIELRPLTLLFGPNSGGKSSVAHALHYLREVLCEGNLDAHKTWSGGDVLDLGGIRNFVHGRQAGRPIRLKAEFTLDGADLQDFLPEEGSMYPPEWDRIEAGVRGLVKSASVEVEIDSSDPPMIRSMLVGLNGEGFAELSIPRNKPQAEIRQINWLHPVLMSDEGERKLAAVLKQTEGAASKLSRVQVERMEEEPEKLDWDGVLPGPLAELFGQTGGSASFGTILEIPLPIGNLPAFDRRLVCPGLSTATQPDDPAVKPSLLPPAQINFEALLSMLFLGPAKLLQDCLRNFRYVGPLRAMPPRQFEPKDHTGRSRWPSGRKAWETLAHDAGMIASAPAGEGTLLEEVSRWLEAEDRLDTGYRLELETSKQVPASVIAMLTGEDASDNIELVASLIKAIPEQTRVMLRDVGRNLTLQPQDVGVGLSQIVPVLVALMDPGSPLVSLEQPELHLHPRQQAALGDAVIRGTQVRQNRVMIIETHSEHLILRLLRRIRETTEGRSPANNALKADQVSVVYVQVDGTNASAIDLPISDDGDFDRAWPNGFFSERVQELM